MSGDFGTIGGGYDNTASYSATVGGGYVNIASGNYATIPGGHSNVAVGHNSFAAGRRANALHDGAFVWADSTDAYFASTGINQFLIRASGGVGIGTNSPDAALHVVGADNDGTTATLKLTSGAQSLLLDGNEMDSTTDIYLQNNSAQSVYMVTGGGRVGIGTAAPSYKLHVNGTVAGVGSYVNASDARYKQHIATFPDALDAILNLRGVTFDWKQADYPDMNFSAGKQIGFIAQELEKILPELVTTDSKGYKSVAYANVVPVLVEAVKQQQKQIEELKARLERLEAALRNQK